MYKYLPLINDVTSGLKLDGIVGQTSNDLGKFSDALEEKVGLDKNAVKLGQKIAAAKDFRKNKKEINE